MIVHRIGTLGTSTCCRVAIGPRVPVCAWSKQPARVPTAWTRVRVRVVERIVTHPEWPKRQPGQSTATWRAPHISRMRAALSVPSRSTRTAIDTLSTESRFTAVRSGTGSSPGSKMTSLGKPRMVVVQGAINVRPNRGIAASRDSTTTGRRPMSGSSHHHSSPRRGRLVMWQLRRSGTRPGRPSRHARRWDALHMRRTKHRAQRRGGSRAGHEVPHRAELHRLHRFGGDELRSTSTRRLWCSLASVPCHDYATFMLRLAPGSCSTT